MSRRQSARTAAFTLLAAVSLFHLFPKGEVEVSGCTLKPKPAVPEL